MANSWISHLKQFYQKNKSKMSYRQAMSAARPSYKKGGKAADAPKKKRGRKKKAQN
jgi:hypothetical protein